MPDSAPALRAPLLGLTEPPMAGSRRPGHVEHEKKTFFSLLKNTRSEDGSQGRTFCVRSSERSEDP
jgi:hypothetical protein